MSKINNKQAQLRAFRKLTDKSLQHLVNEAYRILENPIILCSLDWGIVAHAEGVLTDDLLWNHHISHGTLKKEMVDYSSSIGLAEFLTGVGTVRVFHSDALKYDRMIEKLMGRHDVLLAVALIVASDRAFKDEDFQLAEGICKKLVDEMDKFDIYRNCSLKVIESFMNNLIDDDIDDNTYAVNFTGTIYAGLRNYLYVCVADISLCDPTYAKLEYYKGLFQQMRPTFRYSIYSKHIVIIMSTDENNCYPKKCLSRLNKLFEQENIKVGVSRRFENLFDLSKYYREAVNALNEGLKANSREQVFVYGDKIHK